MAKPMTRHTCTVCGRDVAQEGGVYRTLDRRYIKLRRHSGGGAPCPGRTVTIEYLDAPPPDVVPGPVA